jgi:hypothetical protein
MEERKMRQYEMFELRLKNIEPAGSKVNVDLKGVFEINGYKKEVKGFYAGDETYIIRYYPEKSGICKYKISGIINLEGEEKCEESNENNHGMVHAEGTHFQYSDGKCFYPFGTTVYALSHQEDSLVKQTFQTLEEASFNKIRMCVFPKHYDFNKNEPPYYAFEKTNGKWDVNKPCYAFWDRIESHISLLDKLGIQCDLILLHPYDNWGFSNFTKEEVLIYLDYIIRRLSAYPNIWWSLANEYDLMKYSIEEWKYFAKFIHENDKYGHLLSNHQIVTPWDFSDVNTTHICLQTSELNQVSEQIEKYQKPLMIDECCYEGNISMGWGNISGFEMVNRFWTVCVQGGYCTHGETYLNDEEIIWWSKGGRLIGESPLRIKFLKEIIESLPGPLTCIEKAPTEDEYKVMQEHMSEEEKKHPFNVLMSKLPWETLKKIIMDSKDLGGCYGEEAYLKYYQKHCTCIGKLNLPKTGDYDVEIIDVWKMTREKVMENVNGEIEVRLPGKEGIALLAIKK